MRIKNIFRFFVIALAGVCLWGADRSWALTVDISGGAENISFGVLTSTNQFHTAAQFLKIAHPTAAHRKIYLFTNNAAFGVGRDGLVNSGTGGSFPLYFRNFLSEPASVQFTASEANQWPLVLDRSGANFSTDKETVARLLPGAENFSYVYLGMEIPPHSRGRGTFNARLVIEDWSDVDDVTGPSIIPTAFSNLILLRNVPVMMSASLVDDSIVDGYALHYRYEDGPSTFVEVQGENPRRVGAFGWDAAIDLGNTLRAPSVLEYYFTAVDTWTNVTESVHYRANLYSETDTVPLTYSAGGGSVGVAVGNPKWPGIEIQFPAGSVQSGGTLQVRLKDPATVPPRGTQRPIRVFEFGPSDLSFLRPVPLLLPYLDQDSDGNVDGLGTKETDLRLFWYDGFEWRYVGGMVDPETNQLRAHVSRLGQYALFPFAGSPTAEDIRPKEKILTFNGENRVLTFDTSVSDGPFDIEIFDVRGNSVRKIHNDPSWDGRDGGGNRVESGTYVYRFEGQGITLTGMIAVVR
jgi:hypothetical protein